MNSAGSGEREGRGEIEEILNWLPLCDKDINKHTTMQEKRRHVWKKIQSILPWQPGRKTLDTKWQPSRKCLTPRWRPSRKALYAILATELKSARRHKQATKQENAHLGEEGPVDVLEGRPQCTKLGETEGHGVFAHLATARPHDSHPKRRRGKNSCGVFKGKKALSSWFGGTCGGVGSRDGYGGV